MIGGLIRLRSAGNWRQLRGRLPAKIANLTNGQPAPDGNYGELWRVTAELAVTWVPRRAEPRCLTQPNNKNESLDEDLQYGDSPVTMDQESHRRGISVLYNEGSDLAGRRVHGFSRDCAVFGKSSEVTPRVQTCVGRLQQSNASIRIRKLAS